MSLHGGSSSPPEKKKKGGGFGGFKPAGGGGGRPASSGSTYTPTPPSSGSPSSGSSSSGGSPFGGFKFPGMGDGTGGGGIWGKEPTGPGMTANWSEGTRTAVAVGAVVLIVLALGLLVFGLVANKPKSAAVQQKVSNVTKFVPPTSSAGGKTLMPLTFSDGTTADLLYDPSLDLANLGVSLFDSGTLGNFGRAGRQFQIDHGGASFVTSQPAAGASGLPGAAGASSVPVLPAPTPTQGNYLDFKFGDWHVGVWEGVGDTLMSSTDDQSWAASMTGTQNAAGFLVLTAKSPLKMAAFGTSGGPYLVIGDIFSTGILMTPGSCSVPSGNNVSNNANGVPVRISQNATNHYEGDLCLKDQNMEFLMYGSRSFVQSAADSIEFKNVKPGPAR